MNKSLQDAIEKAKQDPNGLSDVDLEFIYQQGRADAIDECIGVIDTWREDYIEHKEQNPINYGLILDFKRWMHGLKEQKNDEER